ncbi:SAP domain-containing ribonucleoprotein isoform 1-T1 [Discoglossus pictus]
MADAVEIHKLKLAELKQECLSRGLDAKGNKQDLINRLQTYLDEHVEEEANEEDVLGEETEVVSKNANPVHPTIQRAKEQKIVETPAKEDETSAEPTEKEAEKKLVKITTGDLQPDKLQKRAERFNVPASLDTKKAARAARFGITSPEQKGLSTDGKSTVNLDKLKERAQRFGVSVSPVTKKGEDDEKLKKRKERFGIVTSSAAVTDDVEAKKRKRSERFGIV